MIEFYFLLSGDNVEHRLKSERSYMCLLSKNSGTAHVY